MLGRRPSSRVLALLAVLTLLAGVGPVAGARPAVAAPTGPADDVASSAELRSPDGAADAPSQLRTNALVAPMDVDRLDDVELSWQSAVARQNAYQVQVRHDGDVVHDTGRVASHASSAVRLGDVGLALGERYTWSVRIWGDGGAASAWSKPAPFGTGLSQEWDGAQPIWSTLGAGQDWSDYRLDFDLEVTSTALGVKFRADAGNGYMWQFRSDAASSPNSLAVHTQTNGSYTEVEKVPLGLTLAQGRRYPVRIEVQGPTITTWVDGRLVDTRTSDLRSSGVIGFRTGRTEEGAIDNVHVTNLVPGHEDEVLYDNSFDDAGETFPCGTVQDGALHVGVSKDCLNLNLTNNWALLRDEVSIPEGKQVAWATLFATGASFDSAKQYVYKAYVDGRFVGLGPTKEQNGELRYDGFDVTDLLSHGRQHTVSAVAYASKEQKFQADLVVRYTDGSTDAFVTGPSWTGLAGNAIWTTTESLGTSYYSMPQEDIAMREFPTGFGAPGFEDAEWTPAEIRPGFEQTLQATPFAKVTEQRHAPVRIVDKGDGDYFVDFGRSWIGGVHLTLPGQAGQQVRLRFGEELSDPTTVDHTMRTGNNYEDVVTLRDGEQTVDTWGMRTFRYLDVVDSPVPITKHNLQALAMVYPFDESQAQLTSSDTDLVKVWTLARNTIEALNLNFYTDSWTRERTNYEADAYIQLLSSLYLMDDPTLGQYAFDYFEHNQTWPTEWPMYVISAVHDAWQQTGSTKQLRRSWETLVPKLLDEDYDSSSGLIRQSEAIVDWPESQRDGFDFTDYNVVLNALSYDNYGDMAELAGVLGDEGEAEEFAAKAATLREGLNQRFWNDDTGTYVDGLHADLSPSDHRSVHAAAFTGAFGIPADAAQADRVADFIASKGMACSVYCSGFLLEALYNAGHGQDALDLLTSDETHSWLHMIDLGAGATGEAWDPGEKPNMTWSHPWGTAPAFVIPRDMYGIRPTSPGYDTFTVAPQVGDQTYGSVTVPSVKGRIGAAFHRVRGRTDVGVQVPGNTVATVSVPVSGDVDSEVLRLDGRAVPAERADGSLSVEVPAGCHVLSTSDAPVWDDARLTATCPSGVDQPSTTRRPSVSGRAVWDHTLIAHRGRWDATGLDFGYQWLRDGRPVRGATSRTFHLRARDVGHRVAVVVTATGDIGVPGSARSAPTPKVRKVRPHVRAHLPHRVRKGHPMVVRILVTAPHHRPHGRVTVGTGRWRARPALHQGRARVIVHPWHRGTNVLRLTYAGDDVTAPFRTRYRFRVR